MFLNLIKFWTAYKAKGAKKFNDFIQTQFERKQVLNSGRTLLFSPT